MRGLLVAVVPLMSCCGNGGGGSATLSGAIQGETFAPQDATTTTPLYYANYVAGRAAIIGITSTPGICSHLSAGKQPKNTQYLVLATFHLQPDATPVPPPAAGTYSVGSVGTDRIVAYYVATGDVCQPLHGQSEATGGTVTFSSVGDRYAGSYDLTFGVVNGDRVTGTFDAPVCSASAVLEPGIDDVPCAN